MRYYEQRYPEVDELVMVQVRQIAEMGAYVKLVSSSFILFELCVLCLADINVQIVGIRQYRGNDPIVGIVETSHSVYPKTHPCREE